MSRGTCKTCPWRHQDSVRWAVSPQQQQCQPRDNRKCCPQWPSRPVFLVGTLPGQPGGGRVVFEAHQQPARTEYIKTNEAQRGVSGRDGIRRWESLHQAYMREPSYKTDLISELTLEPAPWPLLILYGLQEVTGKG